MITFLALPESNSLFALFAIQHSSVIAVASWQRRARGTVVGPSMLHVQMNWLRPVLQHPVYTRDVQDVSDYM
jgi:hypothetical protein